MCEIAPRLSRSAPPRVLEEILRLMRSGTALGSFRMLRACGALGVILPAIDRYLGPKDDTTAQTRAEGFWRLLEALDADVHQGFTPSTSVCIALLYLRIIEREADPATREMKGAAPDLSTVTAEVLVPVGLQTRLPRRETARARKIILLQRRFVQSSTKRFRPLAFLKSDEFLDALELFRLRIAARGQGWDIYEGWKERHRLAQSLPASEVESERRPRRRRRRRQRGGGGQAPTPNT
jgi:poly(A) polymerase